jgi:hypothetical protein
LPKKNGSFGDWLLLEYLRVRVKDVVNKHGESFIFYDPAQERHNLMKWQRL